LVTRRRDGLEPVRAAIEHGIKPAVLAGDLGAPTGRPETLVEIGGKVDIEDRSGLNQVADAANLRLRAEQRGYDAWQKRDLSARRYVYVWADGVYLQARMEDNAECMLVLISCQNH
jgi:hypothetical protein